VAVFAKQITPQKRLSDFFTPAQKGQKEGSRFHPSKPAVILSGFAVSLFQALITGPQMRVGFGTAKFKRPSNGQIFPLAIPGHWCIFASGVRSNEHLATVTRLNHPQRRLNNR
jgi:hypothetical protein